MSSHSAAPEPGCPHPDSWFDRSLCPEPCDTMHTVCTECGLPLDPCPHLQPTPAR